MAPDDLLSRVELRGGSSASPVQYARPRRVSAQCSQPFVKYGTPVALRTKARPVLVVWTTSPLPGFACAHSTALPITVPNRVLSVRTDPWKEGVVPPVQ